MPSHLHLIPLMRKGEGISDFMRDFKKYTSTKIRKLLEEDGKEYLVEAQEKFNRV